MNKNSGDLATKEYWDSIYDQPATGNSMHRGFYWKPFSYGDKLIELIIASTIEKYKPNTVLEIGCGNSNWLPYIAQKWDVTVYGIDYSQAGCNLVIRKLVRKEDKNNIFCIDFFDQEAMRCIPKVDFIYSLGVVEHFSNTEEVIKIFSSLLNPDGILLTEVPNITGIYKWILQAYQPKIYKKHKALTNSELKKVYEKNNFKIVKEGKLGCFWLGLIAWGIEPRFPALDKIICSIALKKINSSDKKKNIKAVTNCAPYIYIVGKKK